jgi:hypothetical protein
MLERKRFWLSFTAVLLATALAACGDDDDGDDGKVDDKAKPVAGTFVGKVPDTEAFVSVVAAPPAKGREKREVTVLVCDAKRLCEGYSGAVAGNDFVASGDGDAEAKGKLSEKSAAGSIELPGGKTVRYKAGPATAIAGVYELTVSSKGKLSGASATGVGLRGKATLADAGTGTLKLADGKRLKFDVTRSTAGDPLPLRAGQVRLIVTPDYELKGVGKSRRTSGSSDHDFFIRSSSSG